MVTLKLTKKPGAKPSSPSSPSYRSPVRGGQGARGRPTLAQAQADREVRAKENEAAAGDRRPSQNRPDRQDRPPRFDARQDERPAFRSEPRQEFRSGPRPDARPDSRPFQRDEGPRRGFDDRRNEGPRPSFGHADRPRPQGEGWRDEQPRRDRDPRDARQAPRFDPRQQGAGQRNDFRQGEQRPAAPWGGERRDPPRQWQDQRPNDHRQPDNRWHDRPAPDARGGYRNDQRPDPRSQAQRPAPRFEPRHEQRPDFPRADQRGDYRSESRSDARNEGRTEERIARPYRPPLAPARPVQSGQDRSYSSRPERLTGPNPNRREPSELHTGERLSKRMTALGLASRREADEWIEAGWVRVDGRLAVLGQRVGPEARITVDPLAHKQQAQRMTILVNKPVGYVSGQAEDGYEPAIALIRPENQWAEDKSGFSWHPGHMRSLAPAGRLDIDSIGLLVLTQDGRVAKQLIGDDSQVEKEYLVRVEYMGDGDFPESAMALLNHGLEIDGEPLKPAKVSWQNEDQLRFVLREGKKRQIRRMCEAVGLNILSLKRVRIGSVPLGHLPVGQWRYMRRDEFFI